MPDIAEAFKKRSGHSIDVVALPPAALKALYEKNRNFDAVLTIKAGVDELVMSGLVVAATRRTIARSGIGIAIGSSAAKPDVSSSAALERALRDAPTIAFSPGPSGISLERLLAQMKIENVEGKRFKRVSGEPVVATVARGDAAIAFQQMGEMIDQPGIELLGPLPADVQNYTIVDGAIAANRENSKTALSPGFSCFTRGPCYRTCRRHQSSLTRTLPHSSAIFFASILFQLSLAWVRAHVRAELSCFAPQERKRAPCH